MNEQKLAKLANIQTACLACNAGWSIQVIGKQGHQPVDIGYLYFDKETQHYIPNPELEMDNLEVAEFYLHPKHNEELKPREGDLISIDYDCRFHETIDRILRASEMHINRENDYKVVISGKNPVNVKMDFKIDLFALVYQDNRESSGDFLLAEADISLSLLEVEDFSFKIVEREGVPYPYFPPFEWVEV